jgi:thymidine kinase
VGRLEVITGPMFSGKTEELIRRLRRHQIAGRRTILMRPSFDTRYSDVESISHSGSRMTSFAVDPVAEQLWANGQFFDVVGVDEIQFFAQPELRIEEAINWLIEGGKTVIVSGLDMTYRCEPFGVMPHLLAIANSVQKLTAVCQVCGEDAGYTQRLVDGKPAPFAGETIVVGGLETYAARCRQCFETG